MSRSRFTIAAYFIGAALLCAPAAIAQGQVSTGQRGSGGLFGVDGAVPPGTSTGSAGVNQAGGYSPSGAIVSPQDGSQLFPTEGMVVDALQSSTNGGESIYNPDAFSRAAREQMQRDKAQTPPSPGQVTNALVRSPQTFTRQVMASNGGGTDSKGGVIGAAIGFLAAMAAIFAG